MLSVSSAVDRTRRHAELGATMVEFLAVALFTVVCFLGIAQMAVWVWARNVAVSAVAEGARAAAETGRSPDEGAARARSLLHDGLGGSAAGFRVDATQAGDTVAVRTRGTAPRLVPFLPGFSVDVNATAFDEDAVLP